MPAFFKIRCVLPLASALSLAIAGPIVAAGQNGSPAVLDRVVAVVNNHPILASDIADELRFSVLDPESTNGNTLTPRRALQQLISRALIQQQIRQEDANTMRPSDDEVRARILEIRRDLPVCVRFNCASDAGWSAFLTTNALTPSQVEHYVRLRMEILRFIETRFRQGIRISEQDTETYYNDKLLPHYSSPSQAPPLKEVAPRIEEILLQQQVNALFSAWLENLHAQGDVEVLDPSLETPADEAKQNEGDQ